MGRFHAHFRMKLLFAIALACLVAAAAGAACSGSLAGLDKEFTVSDMDFTYQINPCGTVSGSKCSGSNIVVCQEWSGGSKVLGVAENRTITQVSGGVDIRASGGAPASQCDGEPNNSEFEIVCEQGVQPYFTFDKYDAATCTWMFKAKTSAGCGPAPPPTPPSPPVSPGSSALGRPIHG